MEKKWGSPEYPVEDQEFFTEFYHDVEWLFSRYSLDKGRDDFFGRHIQLALCQPDIKKARKYLKKSMLDIPRPDSMNIILQGRNPLVYRDSPGACVMIVMRSGNISTLYGIENSNHQPIRSIKTQWQSTDIQYPEVEQITDTAKWHKEDFEQHLLNPYERQVIHGLIRHLA